jgi:hypothetical protein
MQTVTTIGLDIAKSVFQVHNLLRSGEAFSVHNCYGAVWNDPTTRLW